VGVSNRGAGLSPPLGRTANRWSVRLLVGAAATSLAFGIVLPGAVGAAGAAPKWVMRGVPPVDNFPLKSVDCKAASCVALATECSVGGCGGLLPNKAFFSVNAGVSWRYAAIPATVGDAYAVSCGSPSLCIAAATKGPLGPHATSAIVMTRNGGRSWAVDDEAAYNLGPAAACIGATSCFALGTTKPASSTLTSVGLVTVNAGKSWSKAGFPAKKGYVDAAACAAATACVAVGTNAAYNAGVVFFSANVGRSWRQVPVPAGTLGVRSVSCNGLDCAATTSTQVLVSHNGGRGWSVHPLPSGVGLYFQSAACLTATQCVLTGYQTASVHTSPVAEVSGNGGASWGRQVLPKLDGSLSGVACAAGSCVAVGVRVVYAGSTPKAEYPLVLTY
jgi:hypothetical protein